MLRTRSRRLLAGTTAVLTAAALAMSGLLGAGAASAAPHSQAGHFPEVISLPDGFQPEGISSGRGTSFFVGSLVDGAIYRGDARTGRGSVLVPGTPGQVAVGTEVDRRGRLFVAGGATGDARVYDSGSGALLASYSLTDAENTFVNDVVVTRRAAYFTDSVNPVVYVVPIGGGGRLGEATALPLSGDLVYGEGFNANGIESSPNGRTLLVVQSSTGKLYSVSTATGVATEVDLGGASLTNGDGLLRQGRTLYVVRNQLNEVAVLRLGQGYATARLVNTLGDDDFDVPTTLARIGGRLYAVNARFGTPPTEDTSYTVVAVDGR